MKHVMVDIETMGKGPNAPVISIGAVVFYTHGLGDGFYGECSIESSCQHGVEVDASTVAWWMKQEDGPRLKLANATGSHGDMIEKFVNWFPEESTFWGNGATFDNVILRQAIMREAFEPPWKFWNDRCYRTVKNMFDDVPFQRVGEHHNALDDAKSQALHLIEISKMHGDFL